MNTPDGDLLGNAGGLAVPFPVLRRAGTTGASVSWSRCAFGIGGAGPVDGGMGGWLRGDAMGIEGVGFLRVRLGVRLGGTHELCEGTGEPAIGLGITRRGNVAGGGDTGGELVGTQLRALPSSLI